MKTVRFTALAALLLLAAFPLRAQNEQTEKKEAQSAADAAAAAAAAFAQTEVPQAAPPKPVYWKKAAPTSLGFSQQKLSNWAAGAYNRCIPYAGPDRVPRRDGHPLNHENSVQL